MAEMLRSPLGVERNYSIWPVLVIHVTVVAAVTSNLLLAAAPGKVRLKRGEANLTRASVVNVTQVRAIDRQRLGECLGKLGPQRMRRVLRGLSLVFGTEDVPP